VSEYTTVSTDLQQNLRAADRLVNVIGAQRDEVERARAKAFEEGYRCGFESGDEVGYGRAMYEVDQSWAEVAARSHFLGSPMSKTHQEKRDTEIAACQPRPGDFPGTEHDPGCIDRCRASVESIAGRRRHRAAA
jgi:hypothetical protein